MPRVFRIVQSLTPLTICVVAAASLIISQVPVLVPVPWPYAFSLLGIVGAGLLLVAYLFYSALHWTGQNRSLAVMMLVVPFFLAVTPIRDISSAQEGFLPVVLVFTLVTVLSVVALWITGIIIHRVRERWFWSPRVIREYRSPGTGTAMIGMVFFAWVAFTAANPGIFPLLPGTSGLTLIPGRGESVWNTFSLPSLVPWAASVINR